MKTTLIFEKRVIIVIAIISFDYRIFSQIDEIVLDKNSSIRYFQNYIFY